MHTKCSGNILLPLSPVEFGLGLGVAGAFYQVGYVRDAGIPGAGAGYHVCLIVAPMAFTHRMQRYRCNYVNPGKWFVLLNKLCSLGSQKPPHCRQITVFKIVDE